MTAVFNCDTFGMYQEDYIRKESTFTGSNWGLIWRPIVMSLGISLSLFIATPWLMAWFFNWYFSNMVVDGKQLEFTGTGSDMFFIYLYFLISIVTVGFGAIFMMAWLHRKVMAHVHIKEM